MNSEALDSEALDSEASDSLPNLLWPECFEPIQNASTASESAYRVVCVAAIICLIVNRNWRHTVTRQPTVSA